VTDGTGVPPGGDTVPTRACINEDQVFESDFGLDLFVRPLRKYAVFRGRSSRKQHWVFMLYCSALTTATGRVLAWAPYELAFAIDLVLSPAILVPMISSAVRRLHDTNRSGKRLFLNLVPVIGQLLVLYYLVSKGDKEDNEYGPSPVLARRPALKRLVPK